MSGRLAIPATVAQVLDRSLNERPEAEALVTRRGRWSYRELDEHCARAAGALASLGVRPGDRVAAILPNEADIVFAFHGALRLGAVWVGVNQALAPPEQAFQLHDSEASLLVCTEAAASALGPHRSELEALRTVVEEPAWRAALADAQPLRTLPEVSPDTPGGLAYTSGTTGRPKGVVHTHHGLLVPGAVLVESRGYDTSLRKGDCLPLTILNLLVLTTLLVPQAGGTLVVMDQIHAPGVSEWIERERVTVWNGPPPVLHSLAHDQAIAPGSLRSLREVWSGGAELPEAIRAAFGEKFGLGIIGTYGLSEAPTVVSIDPVDGTHVAGASGQVLPHLAVKVIDDGREVAAGQPGELCLAPRAEGRFAHLYRPPLGYWHRPDATAERFADGLVRTGDVGSVDAQGWLTVRDRKNLVINRGGANVYPAEVERVLDAIAGVAGSAVIGVADERLGQRVVAAVALDRGAALSADELLARCRTQLARYKVPERLVVVDELPRNAMGKVDRRAVEAAVRE